MSELLAADAPARAAAAAAVRRNIDRLLAGQEKDAAEVLRILGDARARLVSMLADGTEFDVSRANAMIAEVDRLMARWRAELPPRLARTYTAALRQGDADMLAQGRAVLGDEGLGLSTGVSSHLLDYASQASNDLVGHITTQTRSTLNDLFRRAAVGSSGPMEVRTALGQVLGEANRPTGVFGTLSTQVERVYRTATSSFYENATRARMERIATESPFEMLKKWVATLDARTRPSHLDMNGVTVGVDEQFDLDGTMCDGPQDSALPAEDAVNCRCTLALVRGPRREGR